MVQASPYQEFVDASPAYGYAQLALAYSCSDCGKRATIFTAKRNKPHPLTLAAKQAGARIVMVPRGYLSNVQAKARQYAPLVGAAYVPVRGGYGGESGGDSGGVTDSADTG